MANIALIVLYDILPGKAAEFEKALREHAARCLELESGCLRFEVMRPLDDQNQSSPNRLAANELFLDRAALKAHRETDRFQAISALFQQLLSNRTPALYEVVV
jgi:autoinducer 2-degrading protein